MDHKPPQLSLTSNCSFASLNSSTPPGLNLGDIVPLLVTARSFSTCAGCQPSLFPVLQPKDRYFPSILITNNPSLFSARQNFVRILRRTTQSNGLLSRSQSRVGALSLSLSLSPPTVVIAGYLQLARARLLATGVFTFVVLSL